MSADAIFRVHYRAFTGGLRWRSVVRMSALVASNVMAAQVAAMMAGRRPSRELIESARRTGVEHSRKRWCVHSHRDEGHHTYDFSSVRKTKSVQDDSPADGPQRAILKESESALKKSKKGLNNGHIPARAVSLIYPARLVTPPPQRCCSGRGHQPGKSRQRLGRGCVKGTSWKWEMEKTKILKQRGSIGRCHL